MNRLKNLEIKKLLKELEFIESDYEYRSEIVSEADSEFMDCVNTFLYKNPKLKKIYDKKITDRIEKVINEKKKEIIVDVIEDVIEEDVKEQDSIETPQNNISQEVRKFYREIVKATHPDKVNDKKLNDIYIKSTELYNNNDKVGLYKVCNTLGIDLEIKEGDTILIEDKINTLKSKISFLESTFTWRWFNTQDDKIKERIVLDFISLKIS